MLIETHDLITGEWSNREWPDSFLVHIAGDFGLTLEEFKEKMRRKEPLKGDVYAFLREVN